MDTDGPPERAAEHRPVRPQMRPSETNRGANQPNRGGNELRDHPRQFALGLRCGLASVVPSTQSGKHRQ